MNKVIIDKDEYATLLQIKLQLDILEHDGVDNWDGYMEGADKDDWELLGNKSRALEVLGLGRYEELQAKGAREMSKTLAEILGWEEGAIYKYGSRFCKIENDMLLSSLTRGQDVWYLDVSILLNELPYLSEAPKAEPKKYYLKHRFLEREGVNYLNQLSSGSFDLVTSVDSDIFKTKFTEDEIEEIEASGFDLCNFERMEVTTAWENDPTRTMKTVCSTDYSAR